MAGDKLPQGPLAPRPGPTPSQADIAQFREDFRNCEKMIESEGSGAYLHTTLDERCRLEVEYRTMKARVDAFKVRHGVHVADYLVESMRLEQTPRPTEVTQKGEPRTKQESDASASSPRQGKGDAASAPSPKPKPKSRSVVQTARPIEAASPMQTMADVARASAHRPLVDRTKKPVKPAAPTTNVEYYEVGHSVLVSKGLVWDNSSPKEVIEEALRRLKRKDFVRPPATAMDFRHAWYEVGGQKLGQDVGAVRPDRYQANELFDFSICHQSTVPRGCKNPDCRHRHRFFCVSEAMAVAYKGGQGFVASWAKALSTNQTVRHNRIPVLKALPPGSQAASSSSTKAPGETKVKTEVKPKTETKTEKQIERKANTKADKSSSSRPSPATYVAHPGIVEDDKKKFQEARDRAAASPYASLGFTEIRREGGKMVKTVYPPISRREEKKEKKEEKKEEKEGKGKGKGKGKALVVEDPEDFDDFDPDSVSEEVLNQWKGF